MPGIFRSVFLLIVFLSSATTAPPAASEPLRFSAPGLQGTQLRLEWTGGSGPFQLQDAPAPNGPWLDVGTAISGTNTSVTLTPAQRFFRVSGVSTGNPSGAEAMMATLSAVQTFVDAVPTDNRPAWRTQIVNFLASRADINSAGETPDGVWAITSAGIPIAMWNNRQADPFDPEDVLPQAAVLRTQTPGNTTARFATTVGVGFRLAGPRLSRQLATHGYAPTYDGAQLDSLQGLQDQSVFFFNTHGGSFQIPLFDANGNLRTNNTAAITEPAYGLWSGAKLDTSSLEYDRFVYEMQAKRLALCLAAASFTTNALGEKTPVNEWHYAITAQWVQDYMTFPPANHASVWLGACLSGSADAAKMRNAFRAAGAEMVSGWTQNVTGDAVLTATSFLYDRLLGANEIQPPATPQRPFNYADSWTELRSRGLHVHPTVDSNTNLTTTEIIYEGASGDEAFGVFAPSIAYVLIDEIGDRVILNGIFGTPPANSRHVKIDGVDTTVVTWEPRKIVCSLPRAGAGSAGEVQVLVHGFKSNIRRITRWTVNGTYKMIEADTPHVVDGTLKMIFRADVGEYRNVPGNVFIRPTRYAVAAQNSEIRLTASGTLSTPCGEGGGSDAYTWLGSALFPTYDPVGNYLVHAVVSLDTIDQTGAVGLAFGMRDPDQFPLKMHVVTCEGATFTFPLGLAPSGPVEIAPLLFGSPIEELLPDGSKYEYPLPGGTFAFGVDWAIAAGRADSEVDSGMQWNRADPEFPPDPAAAR